jgi:hypothetical protein
MSELHVIGAQLERTVLKNYTSYHHAVSSNYGLFHG